MVKLEKQKTVNIKGDNFIFDITKLSVNNFVAIESEKQRLSSSQYNKIATTYFSDSLNAANLIDMIAVFRIMNPKIEEALVSKNLESLNIMDARELLNVYIKEIAPWYRDWMKEFSAPFDEEVKEDEN